MNVRDWVNLMKLELFVSSLKVSYKRSTKHIGLPNPSWPFHQQYYLPFDGRLYAQNRCLQRWETLLDRKQRSRATIVGNFVAKTALVYGTPCIPTAFYQYRISFFVDFFFVNILLSFFVYFIGKRSKWCGVVDYFSFFPHFFFCHPLHHPSSWRFSRCWWLF